MGENTKIEWSGNSWSPWLGCTKVSPGCAHCYAERDTKRYGQAEWGPRGTRVKTSEGYWKKLSTWNKAAGKSGETVRVFPSLCDPFEDWHGPMVDAKRRVLTYGTDTSGKRNVTMDDLRRRMFREIDATPHLTYLLLTKRPENILRMWRPTDDMPFSAQRHRQNVWLGTSIENQETADERIPELLKCRALSPVLWLSYEPALGPVDLRGYVCPACGGEGTFIGAYGEELIQCDHNYLRLDWVIIGGESGLDARPAEIGWFRSAIAQCRAARVPAFFKQTGKSYYDERHAHVFPGDPKGGDMAEWPEDLRVREFPEVAVA